MKYSNDEYVINESYDHHLQERAAIFRHFTKTKDALHTTLITTYGLKSNKYSGNIQGVVSMDDLFLHS